MIWFVIYAKKICLLFLVLPTVTLFWWKLGQKWQCLVVLPNLSRTTGFELKLIQLILIEFPDKFYWKPAKIIKVGVFWRQNLGQIRSNVAEKSKETDIISRFFRILHWQYLLKQNVVVLQIP